MNAYFVFEQVSPEGEKKEFVFELSDSKRIAEARTILSGSQSIKVHVQGKIIPNRVPYNLNWSFHLDPSSISFFEMQIEVCDANVTYVEKHLNEIGGSTLPNSLWCPWSSKLVSEITFDPSRSTQ